MMKNQIDDIVHRIYEHLSDEQSKVIFQNRLMYSFTKDYRFIMNVLENFPQKQILDKLITSTLNMPAELIVYGIGSEFNRLKAAYPYIKIKCFCDKDLNKQANGWNGYDVISPQELFLKHKDYNVLISSSRYWKEIYQNLIINGFLDDQILNAGKIIAEISDLLYFDTSIVKPRLNEVFVDGGCYDCESDFLFMKWCNGKFNKVYAFEPDEFNFKKCKEILYHKDLKDIHLYRNGLWNKKETLYFNMRKDQRSMIIDLETEDSIVIEGITLDEVVGNDQVTFIKMDIEGSELKALIGARNTIIENRPKLAISIYHKSDDILDIPNYILSLHDDYKLYLRHYSFGIEDTVLYAV